MTKTIGGRRVAAWVVLGLIGATLAPASLAAQPPATPPPPATAPPATPPPAGQPAPPVAAPVPVQPTAPAPPETGLSLQTSAQQLEKTGSWKEAGDAYTNAANTYKKENNKLARTLVLLKAMTMYSKNLDAIRKGLGKKPAEVAPPATTAPAPVAPAPVVPAPPAPAPVVPPAP